MSAGGRRRRKGEEEEEHVNHERWLVSYSDMMTVLMALFLVMYAISQVDADKFEQLRASLAQGFGTGESVVLVNQAGIMDATSDLVAVPDAGTTLTGLGGRVADSQDGTDGLVDAADLAEARAEYDRLAGLRAEITGSLEKDDLGDAVKFRVTAEGLVVGMVTEDVFFSSGSDAITGRFRDVVDAIGVPLARSERELKIEGHADIVPVHSGYATNWELSSARATAVLRRLVEHGDVAPGRVSAVGYGDARPLVDRTDADALAANRRVDVVVLSDQPERIRDLLPLVDKKKEH